MAADEITNEELETMYAKNVLGPDSPSSLLYSFWLICTFHFGVRPGKKTHDLKWGDVELRSDVDDNEYIIYKQERQTKNPYRFLPSRHSEDQAEGYALNSQTEIRSRCTRSIWVSDLSECQKRTVPSFWR